MNAFAVIITILIGFAFVFLFEIFFENTKFGQKIIRSTCHVFFSSLLAGILMMYLVDTSYRKSIEKYGTREKIEVVHLSKFRCEQNIKIEEVQVILKERTWFYKIFGNKKPIESYYIISYVKDQS